MVAWEESTVFASSGLDDHIIECDGACIRKWLNKQ
jgi:hypothetical protein